MEINTARVRTVERFPRFIGKVYEEGNPSLMTTIRKLQFLFNILNLERRINERC